MKLEILLMLIVASVICIARSDTSADTNTNSGAIRVIKAELREEVDPNLDQVADLTGAESTHRIVIKPIRKARGKRIRIRLVKKPSKYIRLKVAGTKNVEQSKYPGSDEDGNQAASNGDDDDNLGAGDGEGHDSDNDYNPYTTTDTDDEVVEETVNGEDKYKIKHHHHHHHHNHIKTVVKKVPEPYAVEKIVHVPVEKIVHVPKPYPVEKIVEKVVHVPVEKVVEKLVHIPKPYPVEKIIHVPKIVEKIIHVPMSKDFGKYGSTSTSSLYTDLTTDSKLKFGDPSATTLDILYPNRHLGSTASKDTQFKFPNYHDINKSPPKFHNVLANDNFDFGDALTSKPKDKRPNNNSNGDKKNKKRRHRNKKNNNSKKTNNIQDALNSPSHIHSHSHSYTGVSMPSYTHEYHLSNSDNKEVFLPSTALPPAGTLEAYDTKTIVKYGSPDDSTLYSSSPQEEEYLNWSPSLNEMPAPSAFTVPAHSDHGEEAEVSHYGPIFKAPKKSKGAFKAPRAGPKPLRHSSGQSDTFFGPTPSYSPATHQKFPARFSRSDKETVTPLKLVAANDKPPLKAISPFIQSVMSSTNH